MLPTQNTNNINDAKFISYPNNFDHQKKKASKLRPFLSYIKNNQTLFIPYFFQKKMGLPSETQHDLIGSPGVIPYGCYRPIMRVTKLHPICQRKEDNTTDRLVQTVGNAQI